MGGAGGLNGWGAHISEVLQAGYLRGGESGNGFGARLIWPGEAGCENSKRLTSVKASKVCLV